MIGTDDRGSCRACLRRRSDRRPPERQRRAPGLRGLRSSSRCRGSGHRSSRRVGLGDRARARGPAARGAARRRHDAGWRPARMEAAPSRGQGLAWKPAEAGSSRHLPDRGAGRRRATSRAVGELDAPCLRSGDAFPPLVRQARRRGEMVGADRYRPCTVDRAQTLAPARLRPARSAAPPTARGRLLAGRTPRRRGSPRHVRHCRPQRLRRPLAPARSDVAALSKSRSLAASWTTLGCRASGRPSVCASCSARGVRL